MDEAKPIKVAIVGGGIAGLTLARGLVLQKHLNVTVYEATQKYLDIGGGLAFHGNAMRALELIDPKLHEEYFARATLMSERDTELATLVMVGDQIPEQEGGEALLAELGKAKGRKTVARCDLLEGLCSLVPKDVVKFGKRLTKIEESSKSITLSFKDGTTATTDVLLACDGVHSVARAYLLGPDHSAVEPKNHDNWTWIQRTVPADEVNALNKSLFDRVPIWCGQGAYINSMPLHFGRYLSVSVVARSSNTTEALLNNHSSTNGSRTSNGVTNGSSATNNNTNNSSTSGSDTSGSSTSNNSTSSNLATANQNQPNSTPIPPDHFTNWTQSARDLVTLAHRNPITHWKLQDHDAAPFYSRKRICILGDAAHACMPFNGQGAAQAIEDSAVLVHLFKHISTYKEIEAALQAYDTVRRPRSQRVVELSRQFGRMYACSDDGDGRNLEEIRRRMKAGAMYTNNVDLDAQNEDALKYFREILEFW